MWEMLKVPGKRLLARNPAKENHEDSFCLCYILSPGHLLPGVCLRSRVKFEFSQPGTYVDWLQGGASCFLKFIDSNTAGSRNN